MIAAATVIASRRAVAAKAQHRHHLRDDIGVSDVSAYSHEPDGLQDTHNDRVANEGVVFNEFYGERSCTELSL
jgi:hypothetical protein